MAVFNDVRRLVGLAGVAFLTAGVLGFVPGATMDYAGLQLWETDSTAQLFGLFRISTVHNLVHLAFGLLALAAARSVARSRGFALGAGVLYLALWIYGLAVDEGSRANFLPVDDADTWLHFAVGLALAGLGLAASRGPLAARLAAAGR